MSYMMKSQSFRNVKYTIKWSAVVLLQGSKGPPGPEGVMGPRGDTVSHFQPLAGLSDANRRQTQHSVKQIDRHGHKLALKSFLLL